MNIAGISPQSFQKVNQLLKEFGKAIDPKSPGQATITQAEAGAIVEAFGRLAPQEQKLVGKALQVMLQQDVFTVDDGARAAFAKALGVEPKNLEATTPAGPAPVRSVMKAAMQAITRPAGVDKKTMDDLKAGMRDAPKPLGDFVMAAMKSASEDGGVKMDGDARREFTKEFAARDQEGTVGWLTRRFGPDFARSMPPVALSMLSVPPFFEDLIAAFMITIVKKTNEDVLREQMSIDATLKADQQRSDQLQGAQKAAIKKELEGKPTEAPGPDASAPAASGKVLSTKTKLEAVVSSIDARMADGSISREDAEAIRGKLERFRPGDPITTLLAEAMGTAMQHSGLLANAKVAPRLEPISSWITAVTGKTDFPPPTALSSDKPLARALMDSDKLEQRLAGFLVDAFIDRAPRAGAAASPQVQGAMEKFKPLLVEMLREAAPAEAAAQAPTRAPGTQAELLQRFERLVGARDKMPPGALEAAIGKTVDRHSGHLEPAARQSLKDGLMAAFDALPKGQKASSDQVRSAFDRCAHKVVDDVEKGMTRDELEAMTATVDARITKGLEAAADRMGSVEDSGRTLAPSAKKQLLGEELAKQRTALLEEGTASGYDSAQSDALMAAFDKQAAQSTARFEETGAIAPTSPRGAGLDTTDPAQTDDTRSRQLMFEKLKFKMNMLSEIMQAMSNVLNTMHQNAENAIRAIR